MAGIHDEPGAASGGVEQAMSNKPTGSERPSPSARKTDMDGAEPLDGSQVVESAVSLPEGHMYAQSSL